MTFFLTPLWFTQTAQVPDISTGAESFINPDELDSSDSYATQEYSQAGFPAFVIAAGEQGIASPMAQRTTTALGRAAVAWGEEALILDGGATVAAEVSAAETVGGSAFGAAGLGTLGGVAVAFGVETYVLDPAIESAVGPLPEECDRGLFEWFEGDGWFLKNYWTNAKGCLGMVLPQGPELPVDETPIPVLPEAPEHFTDSEDELHYLPYSPFIEGSEGAEWGSPVRPLTSDEASEVSPEEETPDLEWAPGNDEIWFSKPGERECFPTDPDKSLEIEFGPPVSYPEESDDGLIYTPDENPGYTILASAEPDPAEGGGEDEEDGVSDVPDSASDSENGETSVGPAGRADKPSSLKVAEKRLQESVSRLIAAQARVDEARKNVEEAEARKEEADRALREFADSKVSEDGEASKVAVPVGANYMQAVKVLDSAIKELADALFAETTGNYEVLRDAERAEAAETEVETGGASSTEFEPQSAPATSRLIRITIGEIQEEPDDHYYYMTETWEDLGVDLNENGPMEGEHSVWVQGTHGVQTKVGKLVDGKFEGNKLLQIKEVGTEVFIVKEVDIPIDEIPAEDLRAHIAASEAAGNLEAAAKYQTALDRLEFERLTKIQIDMLFPEDLKALLAASEALGEDEIAKKCRVELASREASLERDHTTEDTAETLFKAVEGGTLPQAKPRGEEADNPIK